ncbi:MAG: SDR family NAD(P)-dependent oxidoreductase [Opitutales bacterium]
MSLKSRYTSACVTGASSGLGKAIAEALRAQGIEVWGTSRNPESLSLEAHEGAQHWLSLDLADADSLASFVERLRQEAPGFDLFINNAGFGAAYPFENFSTEAFERQLEVLLAAPALLCRTVYPRMLQRGRGCLVNVSSLAAQFPLPFLSAYNASKAGLSGLSRSLDLECPQPEVRIIDFRPGDFRTNFGRATELPAIPGGRSDYARSLQRQLALMAEAPLPQKAARDLINALEKGRRGTVCSGTFFQARMAPLLARVSPWSIQRKILRRYMGLAG